jgi:hypothetical protein
MLLHHVCGVMFNLFDVCCVDQVGGSVELRILRGGQEQLVEIALGVPSSLVPYHLSGSKPQYLVVSGLVLTVLSIPYMEGAFGRSWTKRAPVSGTWG